jgi:hypothetical protein
MKKKKTFIEILGHIFSTIDSINYNGHTGCDHVEDIYDYTSGHYTGPGYVYRIELLDDYDERDIYHIVMDDNQKYLGTMAWINSEDGWFNDVDPNWMDKKEIIRSSAEGEKVMVL